ncbi:MAG: T9SS type A sorting domain-containing protein [Flavobacteriales bacterium]|nr:T9SS type A sorting domain-containing protein [Flavobacteriales bacterium]
MKNIYLMLFSVVFGFSAIAQTTNPELTKKDTRTVSKATSVVSLSSFASAATVIWQNDCSNTTDWTLANTSIPPIDWSIEMDPAAIPVTALSPFNSSTASNGYLFINSDATGGGDNDGTPVECTATSPMIDLTGWPYVQLTFSHNYRWWQDDRAVRVSVDGGASWTQYDITSLVGGNVADGYPNLQNSNNPQNEIINISSIAGDQDSVMVQFYYFDNDIWAWYWAVDDVAISEIPDNAMDITDAVQGGWWVNYANVGSGDGYDYTFKPLTQITSNPYSFEAVLRNAGIAPQNTYLNAEVIDDMGSSVYSDVSSTLLLDVTYPQDTFAANSTFSPTTTGVYTVNMWGTGDSTSSSTTTLTTVVTNYIYGRDEDSPDGAWRVGRSCGGMVLGAKYDMYADETLYSIQAHIDDESVVGTSVYAILYEDDPSGDPIYLTQSDDYTITAADLGNWIEIPFDGGQDIYAGTPYVAAIAGYANPVDTFLVSVSGTSRAGCYIQDNGCDIGSGGFGYWYTTSETPMIRMNFDPASLSAENIFVGEFSVHPNPTNGTFTLDLNNVKSDDYKISITNVIGQEVYSTHKEINGIISEDIDISNLEKGVYILEVSSSDSSISEKIILE